MRVAAVQFKARSDRASGPATGLRDLSRLVRSRWADTADRPDLVVCPEMALAGYHWTEPDAVRAVAEPLDGPTVTALGALARELSTWMVCGLPEVDRDRLFNSAVVLDPAGQVAFVYRKTLLFEADAAWAAVGDSGYRAFDTDRGRFGVGICMDLNDDRFLNWCANAQLDAIALPTNWVQEGGSVWDYWRWRLYTGWPVEFDVPERVPDRPRVDAVLVGANSYGPEGPYVLRGESAILSWSGVYATAPSHGDHVVELDSARRRV
jgi:predicted amidohydrolase